MAQVAATPSHHKEPPVNKKRCYKCKAQLSGFRANYLCDFLDRVVDAVSSKAAEEIGDQIITGYLPPEYFDNTQGIERTVLCDTCTIFVINNALRNAS